MGSLPDVRHCGESIPEDLDDDTVILGQVQDLDTMPATVPMSAEDLAAAKGGAA